VENEKRPPPPNLEGSLAHSDVYDSKVPKLSVIVPVYNGGLQLSRCLEGLRLSEYSDFELIVVDDYSTDNTQEILQRNGVYSTRTPRTLGPAGARNWGTGFAQARILVFVDADVVLPPNALGLIAQEFEHDSQLAAVFGSYDEEPAWENFLSQYKNLMHCYVHQNSNEFATTFWAGCGAVRKVVFLDFGGFDSARYRKPSIEDIELGYRLAQDGQKIRLIKQLQVKHLKKWTLRSLVRTDILSRAVPWTRLILETRRLPRDLNLTSGARVSTGLVGLLSLGWVILFLQAANLIPTISLPRTLIEELAVVALLAGVLVALNWHMYSFFAKRRGWWFAARVVPVHWFYYLYSGVVFVTCGTAQMVRLLIAALLPASWSSRAGSGRIRTR
jgi:glycosyltransferase involved in cell wall biosynthesis